MKRVQHEKCASWEKCNTKCPQHEKSAQKVQMSAEKLQHENSTTQEKV